MVTRQITVEEARPLRLEVLRPGRPPETTIWEGDEKPSTTHWGAFTDEGRLVAIATLMLAPMPGSTASAWQIRGMASSPNARGKGYGSAVLNTALAFVAAQERRALVWCNARTSALGFYRAHGFETVGAGFDIPGVGPHWVMKYRHIR